MARHRDEPLLERMFELAMATLRSHVLPPIRFEKPRHFPLSGSSRDKDIRPPKGPREPNDIEFSGERSEMG
jgi:hypothetical protein